MNHPLRKNKNFEHEKDLSTQISKEEKFEIVQKKNRKVIHDLRVKNMFEGEEKERNNVAKEGQVLESFRFALHL